MLNHVLLDTVSAMPYDTFWADLFADYFVNPSPNNDISSKDDMLFFVCQQYQPSEKPKLEVYRRGSPRIPIIGHPGYNWQETLYLNVIMQQFEYLLTLAICTRSGHNELEVLRKHTLTVYASPSRRQLDAKGTGEEIIYPQIFFIVDNFDEVFRHMTVGQGELVCVELVAHNRRANFSSVIFLGSVRHEVLQNAYKARKSSVSSRFSLFSRGQGQQPQSSSSFAFSSDLLPPSRLEFVKMRGPHNKGSAEVAVTPLRQEQSSLSKRFAGSMSLLASLVGTSNEGAKPMKKSQSSETDEDWIERQQHQYQRQPDAGVQSSAWLTRSLSNAFSMWGGGGSGANRRTSQQPQSSQRELVNQSRNRQSLAEDYDEKVDESELYTFLTYVSLPWQTIVNGLYHFHYCFKL